MAFKVWVGYEVAVTLRKFATHSHNIYPSRLLSQMTRPATPPVMAQMGDIVSPPWVIFRNVVAGVVDVNMQRKTFVLLVIEPSARLALSNRPPRVGFVLLV